MSDIEYRNESAFGGSFVLVVRGGRPLGRIYSVRSVQRFYVGEEESAKRGTPDLQGEDLPKLKLAIAQKAWRARAMIAAIDARRSTEQQGAP